MKTKLKCLAILAFNLGIIIQIHPQGYLVQNGVTYAGYSTLLGGYEVDVLHDPTNLYYTGFSLDPTGKTPPTVYTNTFSFDYFVDVGVRVFLVSSNDPISLQPILSQSYTELLYPNSYVFTNGTPFYLGLYTGNVQLAPTNGIYSDPLFGWVELVNNQGVIQMLNSGLEYQGAGIYAGTENIIPIPEPSEIALVSLAVLLLCWRRRRDVWPCPGFVGYCKAHEAVSLTDRVALHFIGE
jgi:hypothetical protein